jgi:hypothetical protein
LLKNYYNISNTQKENNEKNLNLSKLWLIYDIIKNNYFNADEVSEKDLEESIVF